MGLGYALVHPLEVEATVGADPMRVGFDDGVDIVLASIGVGDAGAAGEACEAELKRQVDEIIGQFEGLLRGPLGTLMGFSSVLDADELDLAGIAERLSDSLCNLQPALVHGLITGLINQTAGAVPVLQPAELSLRMRSLATCFLAALEAPLLSGRDDMEAHRGYRAAAMIRLLMRRIFDRLDVLLAGADPVGRLRSIVDEVPDIDEEVVALARAAGCWVRDNVVPMLRCLDDFRFGASGDVDVDVGGGGPSGMPDLTTKALLLEFESKPSPYDREHWLWWMDLATGLVGLATTIFDLQRTSNPPARVAHFISDLLLPAWIAFRVLARAFAWPFINGPPEGTASDAPNRVVRFLFSDFGDFCVQLFLHFIGSISDMFAWSNWLSGFGLRILRYFFYVLQPRMIYLFFRSAWYVKQWDKLPDAEKSGGIPMPRFAWLMFGPIALTCFIVGIFFGALRWRDFSIRGNGPVGPLITGILAAVVGFAFTPPMVLGRFKFFVPAEIKQDRWQGAFVGLLFVFVLLLAMLTFFQTDVGLGLADQPGEVAGWVVMFVVLAGAFIVGPAAHGGWSDVTLFIAVLLGAIAVPGVMMVIAWWFAIADGSDREDVFSNRDPSTSPWLLPYPAGESWLCGQDFHGFFSHEMLRPNGTANTGNHYSYDLNEDFGKRALAARTGIVSDVRDGLDDHNTQQNNMIEVQHLDWAAGHDPGWDLERAITYSGYLHLRRRGVHVTLGQVVRQGRHIADVDDTGISAMNHLHFMGETGQNSNNAIINMPIVFRDESLRRERSAGMISGKPMSLAYFSSDNAETEELSATTVAIPLSTDAAHTHTLAFGPGDLAADGTIPDPVTLETSVAGTPAHIHRISLPRARIEELLRRSDIDGTTTTLDGHAHTIQPLPTQPVNSALSGAGTTQAAVTHRRATFALADPPVAQLLARRPGPYDLLGDQMFLRVNARATEWFGFGAHRPRLPADLVLDRGPGSTAGIRVQHGTVTMTPTAGADLMPRAAALRLTTVLQGGGANVTVRSQPVLLLETRRRGSTAALEITSAPPALVPTAAGAAAGSGLLGRIDQVTRQELRDRIVAALTQQTGVPTVATTGTGDTRTITSGGAPLAGFGGSTGRIEQVLGGLYVPATGDIAGANPLPLTSGIARLHTSGAQTLDVPISGSPARVVVSDLAAARLSGTNLTAEPLTLQVRGDSQAVQFDAGDASPEAVARRVATQAEGVRAWAQGSGVVVETVAAGDAVLLTLSKGGGAFPAPTPGAAPELSGTGAP
ncbi:MAG: M23 family metallopeptidase, partial [Actinomycetota bacterium]